MTRVAVVGHVEWVQFIEVEHQPQPGQVSHALDEFVRAGGGGVVAATALADHDAEVDFFCALGRDEDGRRAATELRERGVSLQVAWRREPTRRVVTLLARDGQRVIVTIGERLAPEGRDALRWDLLEESDGVYFTAGDGEAARHARRAPVVVATPRAREGLEEAQVPLDALVFSAGDPDERDWAARLESRARLMVATEGERGGRWWGESEGRWEAVAPPGPARDDYGCGDSFAAGLTYGLARGLSAAEATAIGAEWGARALTIAGAP